MYGGKTYFVGGCVRDKIMKKEVNEIINSLTVFTDPEMIRREMFGYKMLNRKIDGSAYWKENKLPDFNNMRY